LSQLWALQEKMSIVINTQTLINALAGRKWAFGPFWNADLCDGRGHGGLRGFPLRCERGIESFGKRRKEFAQGKGLQGPGEQARTSHWN